MSYQSSSMMRLIRRSTVVVTIPNRRLQLAQLHHYASVRTRFFATAATALDRIPQPRMEEAEEENDSDGTTRDSLSSDFDRSVEPFNFTKYVYDADLRHAQQTVVTTLDDMKKREYKRARDTRDPLELRLIDKYLQKMQENKKYIKKKKVPPVREELYQHAHRLPKLRPVEMLIVNAEQIQFRSDAAIVKRPEINANVDTRDKTDANAGLDDTVMNPMLTESGTDIENETSSEQREIVYLPPKFDSDDEYGYDEAGLDEDDDNALEFPSLEGSLEAVEGRPTTLPKLQVITTCTALDDVTNTMPSVDDNETMRIFVKPLLIIDPEGILCHRIIHDPERQPLPIHAYRTPLDIVIENSNVIPRPDLDDFLHFLSQHFCIGIWSTHRSTAVNSMVKALFPPQVGRRILFMWSKNYCHAQRFRGRMPRGSDKRTHIFRKSLADVWMQFPLWNESNTLVLDSWSQNMLAWDGNAVHPPAMNGRRILRLTHEPIFSDQRMESDEVNAQRQREFFEKLVQHWKDHPSIHEWYTKDGFQANPHIENGRGMIKFLEEHARGHMGWLPHQRTAEVGGKLWTRKPLDPFKNPRFYYT